ncbi:MAG: glycosyl transferase [Candidatus Omnitrophica bacterium]|nr:glycosyl transferase [Candidatus Omnitrophota bacterium]
MTEQTRYGHFDVGRKEYVITRPDTPTPWINYLGQDAYCALVSNTAGGYSFYQDPRDKRILRYRYNNIPVDRPGRYLYVRDNATGEYWSATWQPVMTDLSRYRYACRHGLGYTVIESTYNAIAAQATYFVPLGLPVEIWMLKIGNTGDRERDISIFSYVEFCLWDAMEDLLDLQYTLNIAKCEERNGAIIHFTGNRPLGSGLGDTAYFLVSEPLAGFDCERDAFIGPYRSESNPLAVESGRSTHSIALGGNPIGSHHLRVHLKAQEEKTIVFLLGVSDHTGEDLAVMKALLATEACASELLRVKEGWEKYLAHFQCSLPDEDIAHILNVWNQYQCKTTFNWSRYASFYDTGVSRGMGFRDSNQDTLGALHAVPGQAKERIIDLAANQFEKGDAYHKYFPLTKKGADTGYSDDQLWLVLSATAHAKETGDFDVLRHAIPFVDQGEGPLYDHLVRAIERTATATGPHGLPLIGYADWNDCLNMRGPNNMAESVWLGEFLVFCSREMEFLAVRLGESKDARRFRAIREEFSQRINGAAWDGEWYLRAFDDNGSPVGSAHSSEGRIYLLPQVWAVISGIAEEERGTRCMDKVQELLDTELGIMLMYPGYTRSDQKLGAITHFPPGLKENGGIFSHANPWAVIAEALLGRGERAYRCYTKISPAEKDKLQEIHRTEPYVYTQYLASREHPAFGAGRNSWLTGSASWNFVAATQYILGIKPDYDGLLIDPCIPFEWKEFRVIRHFRGVPYSITVANPDSVSRGVRSVHANGKPVAGNIVSAVSGISSEVQKIQVVMGN